MAKKYLDNNGLLYVWQKIKNTFVAKDGSKVLSDNNYTTAEKEKLAGIETGATKVVVDTTLSSSSTNPVQNKAVNTALGNKVDKVSGKGLSTNDYTTAEKEKLAGIATGANKTVVDSGLSDTSTNPVQNKVINTALGTKVDKVTGKGLSTNDLTDDLVTKINNTATKVEEIATVGGEPNIIEVVKRNGVALTVTDKSVNVIVPTKTSDLDNDAGYINDVSDKADKATTIAGYGITDAKINGQNITLGSNTLTIPTNNNQLSNGAGYQTSAQVESAITARGYQTKSQVNTLIADAIGDITGISYNVVQILPTTGQPGVIYLVSNSGSNPNSYDEYIYVNDKFEKIGTTDVDLSGYLLEADLVAITNAEIDTIVAS